MGYLINAWNETQKRFTMSLKQVVNIAGDGTLENADSINELRQFFSMIDLQTMERLLGECFHRDKKFKFDTRGFAFQDLINEMGSRLGYEIEHGFYRGRKNEIGFDGLWKSNNGEYIIMESKTSDDYSISMEAVIGYRDQLIIDHKIPKKKCSILIVYGRDDKNALRNTVKGSDEAKNIRLISATALFQLVKIYCESRSPTVRNQINSVLQPRDYFVLDNLVELVFPQTDASIPNIEDTDDDDTSIETPLKPNENPSVMIVTPEDSKQHQTISVPPLPDNALKVGQFVYIAMRSLEESGYTFSDDEVSKMCSAKWTKKTFHTEKPFMKRYIPGKTDNKGEDGFIRFRSKPFTFGGVQVLISKEWYDRQRDYFVTWYNSLK